MDIQIVERNIAATFPQDYPEGFTFPHAYIDFIHKYQGGKPSSLSMDIEGYGAIIFDCFLTFILGDDNDILEQYYIVRKYLGINLLFPIAWDSNLNYFCFDYREDRKKASVVYWDRKGLKEKKEIAAVYYVCSEFLEFLDKFHN